MPEAKGPSAIRLEGFKALSIGIGIGELKSTRPQSARHVSMRSEPLDAGVSVDWGPSAEVVKTVAAKRQRSRRRLGLMSMNLTHLIDVFVVAVSSVIVFVVVPTVAKLLSDAGDFRTQSLEINPFSGVGLIEVVVGVLGIFFSYFFLFRVVVGVTLGESLVDAVRLRFGKQKGSDVSDVSELVESK